MRFCIDGPLSANMGLFMAPKLSTCSRASCCSPALSARDMPSAKAPACPDSQQHMAAGTAHAWWVDVDVVK